MKRLDVLITASSRPQLINHCLRSFFSLLSWYGKSRIFVHEDFVFPEESEKAMEVWKKWEMFLTEVCRDSPPIGLGLTMERMLSRIESPFMFYLQEDWEFERRIDLDQVVWTMEQHEEINAIIFFKYRTPGTINGFPLEECNFDGLKLCLYNTWSLLPGIWRSDFVKEHWVTRYERPEGFFTNSIGSHEQRMDPEFCRKHLGAYLYGPQGDYRYVRHLGNTWRMASWRLEEGQPGGNEPGPEFDLKNRAPWLPKMEQRPSRKSPTGYYPELEEEPPEIQEVMNESSDIT